MARPRKDVMKVQEIDLSQPAKPEGGMAHSLKKDDGLWGLKKPPYPRSELMGKRKVGMCFTRDQVLSQ